MHSEGERPTNIDICEATNESDVRGPMPDSARLPKKRRFPFNLEITEWGRRLNRDYVRSRKRYRPSVADASTAMVHRNGDSPPCLIPGNSSQEEALRLALEFNPFERLMANALIPAEQACVAYNSQNPSRAKRHRRRTIRLLETTRDKLRPDKIGLPNDMPVLAPACMLHIPLIQKLITDLDYTDKSLSNGLVLGMPIAGVIPRTSALPAKETTAAMNLQDAKSAIRATNTAILNSMSKPKDLRLERK